MEFEWDDVKSNACLKNRGFDFEYATQTFFDPHWIVTQDFRWDYGEDRYRVLAEIEGRVFVVVYTTRDSAIRIISARKANAREVADYEHRAQDN